MKKYFLLIVISPLLFFSCNQSIETEDGLKLNITTPIEEGFNLANSDTVAIRLADQVINSMGGWKNWEKANHISWAFIGNRKYYWSKKSGDVRIDGLQSKFTYLLNINTLSGKVIIEDKEVTAPDSLKMYLEFGKKMFESDSYWLIMPFKLLSSGVSLKYLGEENDVLGNAADVIQVTFNESESKYRIYIDKVSKYVTQWDFYSKSDQEDPSMVTPWTDYEKYGNIWLASGRGSAELTDISVKDSIPPTVYNDFAPVSF
jgi:hypothetical protein